MCPCRIGTGYMGTQPQRLPSLFSRKRLQEVLKTRSLRRYVSLEDQVPIEPVPTGPHPLGEAQHTLAAGPGGREDVRPHPGFRESTNTQNTNKQQQNIQDSENRGRKCHPYFPQGQTNTWFSNKRSIYSLIIIRVFLRTSIFCKLSKELYVL